VSKLSLSNISLPIQEELGHFNEKYKKSMKSDVSLVDLITKFILKQKGKKIRPLLVLLASKAAGGINDRSYRGAVLVELLHSATLVHDDIVDNADKRRGLPSINAIWKNKIAVLMGDYLLSRGLLVAVENGDMDFLKVITDAVKRMSEGELLQIYKARKLDIDVETYFKIISDKTASLLSTCCQIGAISATDNPEYREALAKFGETIGIAFQIKDDILDYVGSSNIIGKPSGGDIKEKKITLPLIHALQQAPKSEASSIVKTIRKGAKKRDVKEVIDFVYKYGGIEFAEKAASEYAEKAKRLLDIFPPSESLSSLASLVDFIIERSK
jgi:octaprenyl-diphosphate synthase